jgi:hypothetical protein
MAKVRYSEEHVGNPFNLERWHTEPRNQRIDPPVKAWGADQYEWEVKLTCELVAPDGALVTRQTVSGQTLPVSLDFTVPAEFQFRAASMFAAAEKLNLKIPDVVWNESEPFTITPPWKNSELPDHQPLSEFPIEVVEVDNAWVSDTQGLPVSQ